MSGEAGRIHLASSRDGVAAGLATRSVVASRIVEAAALGIFLLGVVAGVASEHGWRLLGAGVLLIGGALALLRWIPWLRPGRGEGAAVGWTTVQLAAPLALNVGSWGLQWATYHWSIVATGAKVSPALSVLALVLSNVGGILRLTPGNVGVVQGAVVLGLRPAGIEASRAVAAGVALQAVQVLPVLLIGVGPARPPRNARAGAAPGGGAGLMPMGLPRRLAVLTAAMAIVLVTGATEIALWWSARTRLEDFRLETVTLANTLATLLTRSAPHGEAVGLTQGLEGWSRHRSTESQAMVYVFRSSRLVPAAASGLSDSTPAGALGLRRLHPPRRPKCTCAGDRHRPGRWCCRSGCRGPTACSTYGSRPGGCRIGPGSSAGGPTCSPCCRHSWWRCSWRS